MTDSTAPDAPQEKKWRPVFIDALREHGQVTKAAKRARIDRKTAYRERTADPAFAQQWQEALALGVDALEDEAKRRAFEGSDTLLIFLLKSHRPAIYRETTRHEILDMERLSDDELRAIASGKSPG